jgi:hypothetical protein
MNEHIGTLEDGQAQYLVESVPKHAALLKG